MKTLADGVIIVEEVAIETNIKRCFFLSFVEFLVLVWSMPSL